MAEYQHFDGETYITFNIVFATDNEVQIAVTNRGMVREESLIFFIRNKQEPNTPFVTVEYSISQKKVLQCYGEHDHIPSCDVLHYVNKVWLPYANKTLKQIAA